LKEKIYLLSLITNLRDIFVFQRNFNYLKK